MIKSHRTRRILLIAGALLLLAGVVSFLVVTKRTKGQAQHSPTPTIDQSAGKESGVNRTTASGFVLSTAPSDQSLQRSIDQVIDSSGLESARWGVFVMRLRDERVLYAREADRSFVPASNMKLFTSAVALDLLGANYRWRTSIYAPSLPDKDGTIVGNLTLYGRGAPDLKLGSNGTESSLGRLADQLYKLGVRRVRGDVIGDESYFRGEPHGDGWMWNDLQWYYGAEVSALSVGGNEISIMILPGSKPDDPARLKLEPETTYVQIENEARTVARDQDATIGINRGLSNNKFRVWGDFPLASGGFRVRLAVHQPALWAAEMLHGELRARGIVVEGKATVKTSVGQRDNERFDTERNFEIGSVTSITLGEVLSAINKESVNLEAELVLRTLGKERGATAPDPDPRKMPMRGDDEAGLAVVRLWLERAGIYTKNISMHDGSGLSRLNLLTPEATVRLLAAISKTSHATAFRNSLAIAGRDGTLRNRLKPAAARLFGKTGTLTSINSLSGFVITEDKDVIAFSIFCNNEPSLSASTSLIDSIALLLAAHHQ